MVSQKADCHVERASGQQPTRRAGLVGGDRFVFEPQRDVENDEIVWKQLRGLVETHPARTRARR